MVKHNVQALSSSILKVFVQYNSIHTSFPKTFEYREFWNSFSFFFYVTVQMIYLLSYFSNFVTNNIHGQFKKIKNY